MSFDPKYTLETSYPLANFAYGRGSLPVGWTLVSTIQPGNWGIIARNGDTTAIAFRGTEEDDLRAWLMDLDPTPAACKRGPGLVCEGAQFQYETVRDSIGSFRKGTDLLVIGHSIGGQLAALCAYDLRAYNPEVYTFGAPRVGLSNFANTFDVAIGECYRIENRWDIVPHEPPADNWYCAVGELAMIDAGFSDNVVTNHGLETAYLKGLQLLAAKDS